MTEGQAQDWVNGAALVVAGIYFYRKLIEPATGETAASSSAGNGASPVAGSNALVDRFKGPTGSFAASKRFGGGDPENLPGAAAQLLGAGKPASTERFVVGWGFVFLTLSLVVPLSPQLAGSFAALVALGSVLGNGQQVASDLETQLHRKPDASPQDEATATPTTFVHFAGAANTSPAVFPEAAPKSKKKTPNKKTLRVQS